MVQRKLICQNAMTGAVRFIDALSPAFWYVQCHGSCAPVVICLQYFLVLPSMSPRPLLANVGTCVQVNADTKFQLVEMLLDEDGEAILRRNRGLQAVLDMKELKDTKLDLSSSNLGDEGFAFVADALKVGLDVKYHDTPLSVTPGHHPLLCTQDDSTFTSLILKCKEEGHKLGVEGIRLLAGALKVELLIILSSYLVSSIIVQPENTPQSSLPFNSHQSPLPFNSIITPHPNHINHLSPTHPSRAHCLFIACCVHTVCLSLVVWSDELHSDIRGIKLAWGCSLE
jgi:hypothetical protein